MEKSFYDDMADHLKEFIKSLDEKSGQEVDSYKVDRDYLVLGLQLRDEGIIDIPDIGKNVRVVRDKDEGMTIFISFKGQRFLISSIDDLDETEMGKDGDING